ncbi:Purine-cytosine permease fcy21 [Exophiala xenobiotica]|jgi:NCS1 nucleoside transporter family
MADVEKGKQLPAESGTIIEVTPEESYEVNKYGSLAWKVVRWFRAEETGVERVTEEMRTNQSPYSMGILWMSINMVPLGCNIGMQGITYYGMSFWDSALCIIFFNLLGVLPVAYMSTFGPIFGMRQMVLTRFFVGYQVMRLFAFINALTCMGWSILNDISSANLLHTLGDGALPPWACILISVFLTMIITVLGYRTIHKVVSWFWVPTIIVLFIFIARIKISDSFSTGTMGAGRAEAGAVLSYGAALVGNASGWTLFACDYSLYLKPTTSKWKLSLSIYVGILFTTMFLQLTGLAAAACTYKNAYFAQMYEEQGGGGLFYALLVHDSLGRFGQFCIVVLFLSLVACNVACVYSASLSAQAICSKFRLIPRFFWALLANVVGLVVSIVAFYKFDEVLNDILAIISYFITLYVGIFLSEHFIYRRKLGYKIETYQDAKSMPFSYAGLFAFCCGVTGAVIGMYEAWWTGPLAKDISKVFPGDIGFELAFAFAFVGHASTRWLEIKRYGM